MRLRDGPSISRGERRTPCPASTAALDLVPLLVATRTTRRYMLRRLCIHLIMDIDPRFPTTSHGGQRLQVSRDSRPKLGGVAFLGHTQNG